MMLMKGWADRGKCLQCGGKSTWLLVLIAVVCTSHTPVVYSQEKDESPRELSRDVLIDQAQAAYRNRQFDRATALGEELVRRDREEFGPIDKVTRGSIAWQRAALAKASDWDAAIALQQEFVAALGSHYGAGHWQITEDRLLLAELQSLASMTGAQRLKLAETRLQVIECRTHAAGGRFRDSLVSGERALASLQELFGADCWQISSVLSNLAYAAEHLGDTPKAVDYAERALTIYQAHYGDGHPKTAMGLNTLASANMEVGDLESAEKQLRGGIEVLSRAGPDHRESYALMLNNIGELHRQTSQFDVAARELAESFSIRMTLLGHRDPDTLTSLSNLAVVVSEAGELSQGYELQLQAYRGRREVLGANHPDTADSANNLGTVCVSLGQYTEAIEWLEMALAVKQAWFGEMTPPTVTAFNNLGSAYSEQGDVGRAIEMLKLAVERSSTLQNRDLHVQCLSNLASAEMDIGDYQSAVIRLLEAQKVAEDSSVTFKTRLLIGGNLSEVQRRMGKPGAAVGGLRRWSMRADEELGEQNQRSLATKSQLAHALKDAGNLEESLTCYQLVLAGRIATLGNDHPTTQDSRNDVASVLALVGRIDESEQLMLEALKQTQESLGKMHLNNVATLSNLAFLARMRGQHGDAAERLQHAAVIMEQHSRLLVANTSERQLIQSQGQFRHVLSDWISTVVDNDLDPSLLYQAVISSKAIGYRRRLASLDRGSVAIRTELAGLNHRLAGLVSNTEQRASTPPKIRELVDRKEALEKQLLALPDLVIPNWKDIRGTLDGQSCILDFVEYIASNPAPGDTELRDDSYEVIAGGIHAERRLAVFVLTSAHGVVLIDLGAVKRIEFLVDAIQKSYSSGGLAEDVGRDLFDMLIVPLQPWLPERGTLFVCPDGVVARLPMATLPMNRESTEQVIDRFVVQRIPCVASGASRPHDLESQEVVLVGGVDYDAAPDADDGGNQPSVSAIPPMIEERFQFLQGTLQEVDEVQQVMNDVLPDHTVKQFVGGAATELTLVQQLPLARYAVLATHGFFIADAKEAYARVLDSYHPELRVGLACSGANLRKESSEEGLLTGLEIRELDLRRMEIAVLSACQSNSGFTSVGEGTYGLCRSFLAGGCGNVISSLSPIDDRATQLLMREFWTNHLEKKMDVPEALRAAQLKIRDQFDPKTGSLRNSLRIEGADEQRRSRDFYWAPFVITANLN